MEENADEGETEGLGYEVDFPTIELDPALTADVRHTKAKTFEDAREIFLAGQRALNRAKTFYTLNDHCTDFAEIQQDLSRMHKVLIYFEPEEDRQFKMHKRRIDLLESVYKELNPQVIIPIFQIQLGKNIQKIGALFIATNTSAVTNVGDKCCIFFWF